MLVPPTNERGPFRGDSVPHGGKLKVTAAVFGTAAPIPARLPPGLNGLPWPNVYILLPATAEPGTFVGCGIGGAVAQVLVAML
jgi:hypothetical protein